MNDNKMARIKNELFEKQKDVKYDIRDYTIDWIHYRFVEKHFYIPEYQRKFVWNDNHKSKFIESVFLGLPIPFLFLSENAETGKVEIVDGAQRIQTISQFLSNNLKLKNLQILKTFNGITYKEIPTEIQNFFVNRALRVIFLDKSTTLDSRKEIFNRINTSGVQATPVEVRMGTYEGPFIEVIKKCAINKDFIKICPISQKKLNKKEDLELIFRFFAFSDDIQNYKNSPTDFIDTYSRKKTEQYSEELSKKQLYEFDRMVDFVKKYIPRGFRKKERDRTTPRTRFEAISVGVNLALRENPHLQPKNINSWLESDEFLEITKTDAANNKTNLLKRINFVKEKLLYE